MKTLEDILVMLGSKKPFRKQPIVLDKYGDWEHEYYLTKKGELAYGKLIDILEAVDDLVGINNIEQVVHGLDYIADSNN